LAGDDKSGKEGRTTKKPYNLWPSQAALGRAAILARRKTMETTNEEPKWCGKCKQHKPHREFYDMASWCKECMRAYQRRRHQETAINQGRKAT
jgi:uncharacterized CHY-type Zn-finger protein